MQNKINRHDFWGRCLSRLKTKDLSRDKRKEFMQIIDLIEVINSKSDTEIF